MNSEFEHQGQPMKNLFHIVGKEIQINGFVLYSLVSKYEKQFYSEIPPMIAEGKIKHIEERTVGMENATSTIEVVLRNENIAKSVLIVAEE
jgi:NADPH-dependent curcumin reductase CurA